VIVIRASVELHNFDWYVTVGSGMAGETDLSHLNNDITKCIICLNVDRVVTVCVFSTSVESSM
jgi:hypothetical protein